VPELPEVETIRRALAPRLTGRAITDVQVALEAPKLVQTPIETFTRELIGRRITGLDRRGKYLILRLDDGRFLVLHLRMTGRLLHRRPDDPPEPYQRACFRLDDGTELRFADLRKFGTMWLTDDLSTVVGRLGPEPFDEAFTAERLAELAARRTAPIKSFLLDQYAIAGLGNIYADEALHAASIHPRRPARSLDSAEVARLHAAIRSVLVRAVGFRGSSFRDYVDPEGAAGENQRHVRVFRRTGEPCHTCGAAIERVKVGGRSTHFCPRCQPERP
jgi:formamidopyrimidine-DNA glycosylase